MRITFGGEKQAITGASRQEGGGEGSEIVDRGRDTRPEAFEAEPGDTAPTGTKWRA